jgi:hypothetical protein
VPLPVGPSRVYLAPIVDTDGRYSLRVFVVCYDAQEVFIFDPDGMALENVVRTGRGPFAMAFDPFDLQAVARRDVVPQDMRYNDQPAASLPGPPNFLRYRFAYVASFTDSYVQVIDLDSLFPATFERIVFNLGNPTAPKGSQ